jgi:hypothetical protein
MSAKKSYATDMAKKVMTTYNEEGKNSKILLLRLQQCGILSGNSELPHFIEELEKQGIYLIADLFNVLIEDIKIKRDFLDKCQSKGMEWYELNKMGAEIWLSKRAIYVMADVLNKKVSNIFENINKQEEQVLKNYKDGKTDEQTYEISIAELDYDRTLPSFYATKVSNEISLDDAKQVIYDIKNKMFGLSTTEKEQLTAAEMNLKIKRLETIKSSIQATFSMSLARHKVRMLQHDYKVMSDLQWKSVTTDFEKEILRHQYEIGNYDKQIIDLIDQKDIVKERKIWR